MISPHGDTPWQTCKDGVIAQLGAFGSYTMEHLTQIDKLRAKHLTYGLMTQAYTEHGLMAGIGTDDIKQQSCLRRDARSWRKDNAVERLQLRKRKLIVSKHCDICSQLFYKMTQVVGKRVVIINDHYFHHAMSYSISQILFLYMRSAMAIARLSAPSLLFTS